MKVKIDKMPTKPQECLFSSHMYHTGYICKLNDGRHTCDVETCKYLKVDDDSRNKRVETKPVDDAIANRKICVNDLPNFVNECSYAYGKATRMDCDYYECSLDKKECISTSRCRHFEKVKVKTYTPESYELEAMRTVDPKLTEDKRLLEGLVGMNSEAGEALDIWKKYKFQGHDLDKEAIALELGDVLWYLTEAAVALGYSLETIMKMNIVKLQERYPNGFDPEKSKNRSQ